MAKEVITGAEALMRSLKIEEVKTIFGYPGGSIMPVFDALYGYTRAGFDSVAKWYVSMQCVVDWHYNPSFQNFIWQRKLCSCCLIES